MEDVGELPDARRIDVAADREPLEDVVDYIRLVGPERLDDDRGRLQVGDPLRELAAEVRILAHPLLEIGTVLPREVSWHVPCAARTEDNRLHAYLVGAAQHLLGIAERRAVVGVRPRQPELAGDEAVAAPERKRPLGDLVLLAFPPLVVLCRIERGTRAPLPEIVAEVAHYRHVLDRRPARTEEDAPLPATRNRRPRERGMPRMARQVVAGNAGAPGKPRRRERSNQEFTSVSHFVCPFAFLMTSLRVVCYLMFENILIDNTIFRRHCTRQFLHSWWPAQLLENRKLSECRNGNEMKPMRR